MKVPELAPVRDMPASGAEVRAGREAGSGVPGREGWCIYQGGQVYHHSREASIPTRVPLLRCVYPGICLPKGVPWV